MACQAVPFGRMIICNRRQMGIDNRKIAQIGLPDDVHDVADYGNAAQRGFYRDIAQHHCDLGARQPEKPTLPNNP